MKIIDLSQIVENPGDRPLRLFGALRNYIREQKLQTAAVIVRLQVGAGLHSCKSGVFSVAGSIRGIVPVEETHVQHL